VSSATARAQCGFVLAVAFRFEADRRVRRRTVFLRVAVAEPDDTRVECLVR
jgi:hypothetical protein